MELSSVVKSALPMLATAFGGPLAGMATDFICSKLGISPDTTENVKAIISGLSPEKLAELKSHEDEFKLKLAALGYDSVEKLETLNASVLIEVNKTMQAESASEHWPTYSWRPFIGFQFGLYIGAQWILPLFGIDAPKIDPELMLAIGGILGVASWFRGKAQATPDTSMGMKG